MLFFNKARLKGAVVLDKPLDQSSTPSSLSQGRSLFAEPLESEELGLVDIDENLHEGIRVPDIVPADLSSQGVGDASALDTRVTDTEAEVVIVKQVAEAHTHVEAEITDLDHYKTSDFTTDFAAESLANLTTRILNNLSDVTITTPANDEVLAYNTGTSEWINQTPDEAGLASATHTHLEADISDLDHYTTADFTVDAANLVVGPASATDDGVALFNGTTGKLIKSPGYAWTMIDVGGFNFLVPPSSPSWISMGSGTRKILQLDTEVTTVNWLGIRNAGTGNGPILSAESDTDTHVNVKISPKGANGFVDVDTSLISNVVDPVSDQDAATKKYADDNFATTAQGALADSALQNVVEDTTPQLGGMLDVNGQAIGDGTRELLKFIEDGSSINEITIANAANNSGIPDTGPIISATGDNSNIPVIITPKGTASILSGVNGTLARPAYSFLSDPDTGVYLQSSRMRWAFGGVQTMNMMATQILSNVYFKVDADFVVDETNADFFVDDSTGRVGINTATPEWQFHVVSELNDPSSFRGMNFSTYADNTADPLLTFEKTRGSQASKTAVVDGDKGGTFQWYLHDGTSLMVVARLRGLVTGAVSTGNIPMDLTFETGKTGAVETMRLTEAGRLGIGQDTPTGQLHVDQNSTSGAIPVLTLDQADVSEEMMEFITTIGTGNAIEAIGVKTLTTTHFVKVTIPGGLTRYFPIGTIA